MRWVLENWSPSYLNQSCPYPHSKYIVKDLPITTCSNDTDELIWWARTAQKILQEVMLLLTQEILSISVQFGIDKMPDTI